MPSGPEGVAGVDDVPTSPRWEAEGDRAIRARGVHPRHMKLLALLREDLGGVTNQEAIAALLEYYYRHPDRVSNYCTTPRHR